MHIPEKYFGGATSCGYNERNATLHRTTAEQALSWRYSTEMQRIGLSVRGCCAHRTLVCRSFNNWKHPLPTSCRAQGPTRRLSSTHDDFWTCTQSEAKSTPAYDNATRVAPDAPPPTATPTATVPTGSPATGGYGAEFSTPPAGAMPQQQQQRPAGEAYRPPSPGDGPHQQQQHVTPPPAFDMSSPMHLSPVRQIDVRSFKGTTLVDIRQYYTAESGTVLPTKKGISLTVAQWETLKGSIDSIDKLVQEQERSKGW